MTLLNLLITTALLAGGGIPLSGLFRSPFGVAVGIERVTIPDPEYLAILGDLSETHRVQTNAFVKWRDSQQWQAVADTTYDVRMLDMTKEEREPIFQVNYDLAIAVMRYPLHERMPAHAVISPAALKKWHEAKTTFLQLVSNPPRHLHRLRLR